MGFFIALVYVVFTHLTPEFLIASMAVDRLMPVLLLIGLVCAVPTLTTTGFSFRAPQVYLGFAFVMAAVMSQIAQGWFGGGVIAFEKIGLVFGVFLLVATTTVSYARLRILATTVIAMGMIYSIIGYSAVHYGYGGSQFLVGENLYVDASEIEAGGVVRMRGLGFLADPNDLGEYLVICIALLAINWKAKSIVRNFFFVYLPGCLLLYGIFITHSRGAFVGLAGLLFLALKPRMGRLAYPAGALGAAGIIAAMKLLAGREVTMHEESAAGRMEAWSAAIQMFKSAPVFGVGFRAFTDFHELTAHNSFALCLAELGFVGSFIWLAILVVTMMQLNALSKYGRTPEYRQIRQYAQVIRAALVGYMLTAWFLSRTYTVTLFMIVGMALALTEIARRTQPELATPELKWAPKTLVTQVSLLMMIYLSIRFFRF